MCFFILGRERKKDTWRFTQTLRNKAEIGINLGKGFVPYISGEVFMRFKDPDGILHKWRATTGLGYTYKSHEFDLYFRGEGFLNNQNVTRAILGTGYRYVF